MTNTITKQSELLIGQVPTIETLESVPFNLMNFHAKQTILFIMQIRKEIGDEPMGSSLCALPAHEEGITEGYIARYRYDATNHSHQVYADKLEIANLPKQWSEENRKILDSLKEKSKTVEVSKD